MDTQSGFSARSPTYTYGSDPSVKHDVGQFLGHVLNALPGYSTTGANITNPNVNYSGAPNAFPSGTVVTGHDTATNFPTATPLGMAAGGDVGGGGKDPYAQWGGQGAYNNLMGSFNTQKSNIQGSANDWGQNYGQGFGQNITDYINSLRTGQQGIDEQGVQNELALNQGRQGILGMVSRGIRSGGVMLANRNASDSSASAALANAYGEIGRGQLSNVGNQYAVQDRNIGIQQGNFDQQAQAGANRMRTQESQDINGAVNQARDRLATLDAWAADRSLPERIQVEQEKSKIQNQIQSMLAGYEGQLSSGVAGVRPTSHDQRRATATELAGKGTVPTSPFDFTSQMGSQFQNQPFSGQPLFTTPRKKVA